MDKLTKNLVKDLIDAELTDQITNSGLWNGNGGIGVTLLMVANLYDDLSMLNRAQALLEKSLQSLKLLDDFSFADGTVGVAWMFEWLHQNEYSDISFNEIINDVDDHLYRLITFSRHNSMSLDVGSLGQGKYSLIRNSSLSDNVDHFRTSINLEMLVMVSNDIFHEIFDSSNGLKNIKLKRTLEDVEIARAIIFFADFLQARINTSIIETALYELIRLVDELLSENKMDGVITVERIALAYAYFYAGKKYQRESWEKKGERLMRSYLNEDLLLTEFSNEDKVLLLKICALFYEASPNRKQIKVIFELIYKRVDLKTIGFGLGKGICSLIVSRLLIYDKEACNDLKYFVFV